MLAGEADGFLREADDFHDPAVADRLADYVDETRGRYPPATPPDHRG